ncbi:hypothetical protein AVEN_182589-1 [Araneus ventricosus]|uniref:Uncharacterized protein n=1 Tax=Araneus ventricosus TaxID=182803 RepID=A0A4Y2WLV0_ARAVE|nr:hypothetical protein AVEN_182589-1 [Araneus ventricosus]
MYVSAFPLSWGGDENGQFPVPYPGASFSISRIPGEKGENATLKEWYRIQLHCFIRCLQKNFDFEIGRPLHSLRNLVHSNIVLIPPLTLPIFFLFREFPYLDNG